MGRTTASVVTSKSKKQVLRMVPDKSEKDRLTETST